MVSSRVSRTREETIPYKPKIVRWADIKEDNKAWKAICNAFEKLEGAL